MQQRRNEVTALPQREAEHLLAASNSLERDVLTRRLQTVAPTAWKSLRKSYKGDSSVASERGFMPGLLGARNALNNKYEARIDSTFAVSRPEIE
jgi:hypothetical protein